MLTARCRQTTLFRHVVLTAITRTGAISSLTRPVGAQGGLSRRIPLAKALERQWPTHQATATRA